MDIIDDWDFQTRLPTENDVDANKFVGIRNSIVLTLIPSSPYSEYYPGIGEYNDVYLLSDTPCEGNNLVLNGDGVAVTNTDGSFVRT